MNQETKTFDLETILSVTTGYLLTKRKGPRDNGIGDMYKILDWMTGDSSFTHTLGRFAEECKPWLYRWFPELATAEAAIPKYEEWLACDRTEHKEESAKIWFAHLKMIDPRIKSRYPVPRIPQDDHVRKHPWDEMVAGIGTDEGVIVVETPEDQ